MSSHDASIFEDLSAYSKSHQARLHFMMHQFIVADSNTSKVLARDQEDRLALYLSENRSRSYIAILIVLIACAACVE